MVKWEILTGGTEPLESSVVSYNPPRAPEPLVVFCSVSRVENAVIESCCATTSFGSVAVCTIIELAGLAASRSLFFNSVLFDIDCDEN